MDALVVFGLSGLDAYTHEFGQESGKKFADAILDAIGTHDGPVYIVDQRWRPVLPDSKPRLDLYRRLLKVHLERDIVRLDFPGEWDDLEDVLLDVRRRLERDAVESVLLGGLWFDPAMEIGCATRALVYLNQHVPTRVHARIVGCVPRR